MSSVKFSKDFLVDELNLPDNDDIVMLDEIIDHSRWSVIHNIVFEHEGKFYQTGYSVGATESQYESPWEYDDEVECTEVELKEVMVKQWVTV